MEGEKTKGEREFEIGKDESWFCNNKMLFDFTFANMKRTYDVYQDLDLKTARDIAAVSNRIMHNAVTADHVATMQALGQRDIAADRQWNVDEVAELVAQTSTFKDAIAGAVAAAVAEALVKK